MSGQHEIWTSNTLRRTTSQAFITLQRAREREIIYPPERRMTTKIQEPTGHMTLEDSFSSVMQSLSKASTNCLTYYRSSPSMEHNTQERRFCARYLMPKEMEKRKINPLQEDKDVQIIVTPGTYSLTARASRANNSSTSLQTRVINVAEGEMAAIDFTI